MGGNGKTSRTSSFPREEKLTQTNSLFHEGAHCHLPLPISDWAEQQIGLTFMLLLLCLTMFYLHRNRKVKVLQFIEWNYSEKYFYHSILHTNEIGEQEVYAW